MDYHKTDFGPDPAVFPVEIAAMNNQTFRTAVWTGCYIQMTLMSIPPCGEIGMEIHEDTDQYIRVEKGCATVWMGECKNKLDFQKRVRRGDGIFIPAGTWHNILNTGRHCLKISSVYAPPHHPAGTVQFRKEDAR